MFTRKFNYTIFYVFLFNYFVTNLIIVLLILRTMKKDHWSKTFNPIDVITEILPEDGLLLQSILNEVSFISLFSKYLKINISIF